MRWENYNFDRRLIELQHEYDYLSGGALHQAIAAQLNDEYATSYGIRFTEDSVRNRLKRITFDQLADRPVTVIMPYYQKYQDLIEGDGLPKLVNGYTFESYLQSMQLGHKKTLVLSDLHIPFINDQFVQEAVERNLTADLIVLNGDIFDAYSLSTFVKTQDIPIYAEIDGIVRFFEWITQLFPDKFIVSTVGNHETRVTRRISPMLPSGLEFLAKENLLTTLAKPFPNIVVTDDWYVQVGDAIYAHADSAAGVAAKPAVDVLNWFVSHYEEENLAPFRLTCHGHTHRTAVVYQGKYKAMESGCLCVPMSYARTTKHRHPSQQGYVVVQQFDGRADFQLSREYTLNR